MLQRGLLFEHPQQTAGADAQTIGLQILQPFQSRLFDLPRQLQELLITAAQLRFAAAVKVLAALQISSTRYLAARA